MSCTSMGRSISERGGPSRVILFLGTLTWGMDYLKSSLSSSIFFNLALVSEMNIFSQKWYLLETPNHFVNMELHLRNILYLGLPQGNLERPLQTGNSAFPKSGATWSYL